MLEQRKIEYYEIKKIGQKIRSNKTIMQYAIQYTTEIKQNYDEIQ